MSVYTIGKFIKTRRVEMGISQQELAEGICSAVTLSRIESGETMPTQKHIRALLQRLGYSSAPLMFMADTTEEEIARLQFEIKTAIAAKDYKKAAPMIESLGEYKDSFGNMDMVFYEVTATIVDCRIHGLPWDAALPRLENALRLTHPSYSRQNLPFALTYTEVVALNTIANCLRRLGHMEDAVRYYRHIQTFYEEHVQDPEEAKRFLPTIYYNHSKVLGLLGRYDECIEICSRSVRYAHKVRRFASMPETLYNMAWSMVRRNKPGDREAARHAAREAYVLNSYIGAHKEMESLIKKLLHDYYGEKPPVI